MEDERVSLWDQQLQMKEEATRLKLSQLKELLRQSRAHSAQGREYPDRHTNGVSRHREVIKPDQQDRFDHIDDDKGKADEVDYTNILDRPFSGRPISQMSDALLSEFSDGRSSRFSDRPSSGRPSSRFSDRPSSGRQSSRFSNRSFSQMSTGTVASVPDSDFYADRKKEKDPTTKWNSPYSRPTTPTNSLPDIEITSVQDNSIAPLGENYDEELETIFLTNYNVGHSSLKMPSASVTKDNSDSNGHSLTINPDKEENKIHNSNEKDILDEGPISDDSKGQKRLEKNPKPTTNIHPSRYARGMDAKTFDPQKMDLSKNSFDSTLADMLGSNDFQTSMALEHYDQFARQTNPRDLSHEMSPHISPYAASLTSKISRPAPRLPTRYVSPYTFPVIPKNTSGVKSDEGPQNKNQSKVGGSFISNTFSATMLRVYRNQLPSFSRKFCF